MDRRLLRFIYRRGGRGGKKSGVGLFTKARARLCVANNSITQDAGQ